MARVTYQFHGGRAKAAPGGLPPATASVNCGEGSYLVSSAIKVPPSSGTYDYNAFTPPAAGGNYTDPVFGGIVHRLNNNGAQNNEDIYAHCWVNCDGTLIFHRAGTQSVLRVSNGTTAYSGQPMGNAGPITQTDVQWSMTDPDAYYYLQGTALKRHHLAANTDDTVYDFGFTLKSFGGSVNFCDKTGTYFVVQYDDGGGLAGHVVNINTSTLYTGSVAPAVSTGWMGFTPSGNYVITGGSSTNGAGGGLRFISWAINHSTHTVAGSGTEFWSCCGDHGVPMSGSDGKDYIVSFDCNTIGKVWRIDVSLNQLGQNDTTQTAANQLLLDTGFLDGHFTAIPLGSFSDWIFIDTESHGGGGTPNDVFNYDPGTGWFRYCQEIIGVNFVTLEVRRFAHHRSRSTAANYYNQPRVSCSADGSVVVWTSNMNDSTPTSDYYYIKPNLC